MILLNVQKGAGIGCKEPKIIEHIRHSRILSGQLSTILVISTKQTI